MRNLVAVPVILLTDSVCAISCGILSGMQIYHWPPPLGHCSSRIRVAEARNRLVGRICFRHFMDCAVLWVFTIVALAHFQAPSLEATCRHV
jgi:hypothetical protein